MITYTAAIENAIYYLSATHCENDTEKVVIDTTIARLQALSASLVKRNSHKTSDAAKEKQAAKRAEARNEIVNVVAPIVRNALTSEPSTVKEIFERCKGLPEGFTAAKVQYLLLHELAEEVVKAEAKGKPNTYHI